MALLDDPVLPQQQHELVPVGRGDGGEGRHFSFFVWEQVLTSEALQSFVADCGVDATCTNECDKNEKLVHCGIKYLGKPLEVGSFFIKMLKFMELYYVHSINITPKN